ncbi:PGF-CTERM-anchored ABC transporter substrate-binding protein [Natrinema salifodinae]|uniref:Iron complex transport system substrate-binding protein n=1 Tax=Natrinema salifodinae TaxID=1202768 RepID=A0A1I0QX47_9EURY|nr:PGF-CTERM-anchored ABC transporter substrate-binding protein [Natrinema salifodinae]SEW32351.1 iron complex transport system substrate-binding protein [Natrinema salifodinae]
MRTATIVLMTTVLVVAGFAPATVAGGAATDATQQDADCDYPLTLTDTTGEEVTLDEPPERVVALQPSDTQTVFEIGAEDRLVGMPINQYTDSHDPGDRTDIDISGDTHVDVETVIALEPDIVLADNVTEDGDVEQLRDAGLTVYHFDTATSIDDIRENVRLTGQLTGECAGAEERIDWMDDRLEIIESALEDEERPLAYWSLGFGYTAGAETFQNEVLTTAGVQNLAAEAGLEGWPDISDEVIVEQDPEWIIYGVDDEGDDPGLSEGAMATTAYENDQLVAVDANQINQPAPHVVYAIETIVEEVHPEAYAEIEAELEDDADTDGADDDQSDASDEAIPGFGVPVAVAALLATLGALTRRQ